MTFSPIVPPSLIITRSKFCATGKTTNDADSSDVDIMKVILNLQSSQSNILSSNKKLAESQSNQFAELGKSFDILSKEITDLKNQNSLLQSELNVLKDKVLRLKLIFTSRPSASSLIAHVIQQTIERLYYV